MAPKTDVIAEPRETIAAQAAEIERLTKINAEICSKSNWYVVENARFEEKLTDSQHKVKVLTDALEFAQQTIGTLHLDAGDGECHYPIIDDALDYVKELK